ncbi:hypothetical protein [Pedobacter sp. SYSU D00535]|uniref:hypothetical protein n=1 Tax=Pedobacter sp. SYSU D00535 TaxID=2810308 RepID=UPI001A973A7A|nr:hypothetical protein [Pedobacter sp. SYSU D00535]
MKNFAILMFGLLLSSACSRPSKDLASVEIGMTKDEVVQMLGEPKKKDVVNQTELWNFTDSGRTIVFRADTVYAIMTSPRARMDSVAQLLDSADQKVKKGFNNVGDKIENVADKIGDKLDRDTTN